MPSTFSRFPIVVLLTTVAFPLAARQLAAEVPTPEAHFGFRMGADGRLATAGDSDTLNILDNVVLILIPSLNPDGHRLVVDWYNQQKGTPYEGGPMPWLYHKYAGHDINRDAFMMNMAENRNLSRFFYTN